MDNETLKFDFTVTLTSSIEGRWKTLSENFWEDLGFSKSLEDADTIAFIAGKDFIELKKCDPKNDLKRNVAICREGNVLHCRIECAKNFVFEGGQVFSAGMQIEEAQRHLSEFMAFLANPDYDATHTASFKPTFSGCLGLFWKFLLLPFALLLCLSLATYFASFGADRILRLFEKGIGIKKIDPKAMQNREGFADVYLLPVSGFDEGLAGGIAAKLSEDLKINVRTSCAIPVPQASLDMNRDQYIAPAFVDAIEKVKLSLFDTKPDTVYIALVNGSVYIPGTPFRFVFACYFDRNRAVVGNQEMSEGGFAPESMYNTRMYKFLKRSIGRMYFNYPPNSNPESLMKAPVQSLMDIDKMGFEY